MWRYLRHYYVLAAAPFVLSKQSYYVLRLQHDNTRNNKESEIDGCNAGCG